MAFHNDPEGVMTTRVSVDEIIVGVQFRFTFLQGHRLVDIGAVAGGIISYWVATEEGNTCKDISSLSPGCVVVTLDF